MAKLKKTKNELKAQREALQRYERFLPTLELKKQQLQREVRRAEAELRRCRARRDRGARRAAPLGGAADRAAGPRAATCVSRGWTWRP